MLLIVGTAIGLAKDYVDIPHLRLPGVVLVSFGLGMLFATWLDRR